MRWLLPIVLLTGACRPVDTERIRVRGSGLTLEVVARSDPDQVHMRRFAIDVEPAATIEIACDGAGDRHVRELDRAAHLDTSLFGLLAEQQYDCAITATRDGRSLTGELAFETDEQRATLPDIRLTRGPTAWGHYTVFNTWQSGQGGSDHQIVIVDDQARVRWHMALEDSTSVGLEVRPMGRHSLVLGGGKLPPQQLALGGKQMWAFPDLKGKERYWHHEAHPTPHGTILGIHAEPNVGGAIPVSGFRVVERDIETDIELWSWDSQTAWDAGLLPTVPADRDPWHANAASWVDGDVVVSLPGVDRVLRIDPDTDAIVDELGGGLFSGQHDPEWAGDRVLVHDNGIQRGQTRLLELAVDRPTPEIVWEWTEPGWFEPLWGDADRLPDGTVLVARGHCSFCPEAGSGSSSIRIVDPQTNAVPFELALPDRAWAIYRAERVHGCDLFDNQAVCSTR